MDNLIGREAQIKILEAAKATDRAEMVAVVGRRRIGKTYLIRQFFGADICFELTGLQQGGKQEQLTNFQLAFNTYFPKLEMTKVPSNWLVAFDGLARALEATKSPAKQVVFLDELPWLGGAKSGFIQGLSYFWNTWASKQRIAVVICGSAASWMIDKVINDKGGLHNRVTRLLYLYPFTLSETEAFCRLRNINLNRYQLLQIYMTIGGVPMYLDQLKQGLSAIQNIQAICFHPTGYLRHEFDRLYASLFMHYEQHVAIIRVLGKKRKGLTRQEIISNTKLTNGGALSKVLDELEQSGFITLFSGYGKKVKETIYRLTDAYSLFYLTYIEPLGKGSQVDFAKFSDLPSWKSWSGYAFENVCFTHIEQIRKALGIAGVATSVSSFISQPTTEIPGTQIDLVIDRNDQSINICEAKFSTSPYLLTKQDIESFRRKKEAFQSHTQTPKHLFLTLIAAHGVVDNRYRSDIDQVIVLDDLFG